MKTAKLESAESVRQLLERAGLNQCEAARLIGVDPRTMRRYVSLNEASAVEMPPPAKSLLIMVTDQLVAARQARRPRLTRSTSRRRSA